MARFTQPEKFAGRAAAIDEEQQLALLGSVNIDSDAIAAADECAASDNKYRAGTCV